jgi:hypothetical protein
MLRACERWDFSTWESAEPERRRAQNGDHLGMLKHARFLLLEENGNGVGGGI